jgi:heat shock protein HspQ
MTDHLARFALGQIVRHRLFPFRGVVFDVDPQYANTEAWYLAIPEHARPKRDQPFYHLLAENEDGTYMAYVSEQNLQPDNSGEPIGHPQAAVMFQGFKDGHYLLRPQSAH